MYSINELRKLEMGTSFGKSIFFHVISFICSIPLDTLATTITQLGAFQAGFETFASSMTVLSTVTFHKFADTF